MSTDIIARRPVSRREKYQNRIGRKIMLAIIVALYFLGTIEVAVNWAFTRYSFITHGEIFWTIYSTFVNASTVKHKPSTLFMVESVATSIAGGLQNIIADTAVVCISPSLCIGHNVLIVCLDMALLDSLGVPLVRHLAPNSLHDWRNW